jgi:hypothetical protein
MLLPNVNTKGPEVPIATQILWPILFEIWTEIGNRKLASTKKGPTYRFLALVHEVGDLPRPTESTIKKKIRDW